MRSLVHPATVRWCDHWLVTCIASCAIALAAVLPSTARAQRIVTFPHLAHASTDATTLCAAAPSVAMAGSALTGGVRDSVRAAAMADSAAVTILAGEPERARDQLRLAAVLDPRSPELAFRLARVAEDLGDATLATSAYCHLRAISRDQAQMADATTRIESLAVDRGQLPPGPSLDRFQRGVSDAAAGALPGAERAFDEVVNRAPTFAIAYYDRALVRLALNRPSAAAADLRQFAILDPRAATRDITEARGIIARGERSVAAALGWGVVPGGSQVYTGRPWLGAVVAAATAAGVVLALQKETRMEERTFTDPFGQPYVDMVPVTVYPRRSLGLAVAGGSTLAGALGGMIAVSADRAAVQRLVARVRSAISQSPPAGDDDRH